jgi:hypothetical protein
MLEVRYETQNENDDEGERQTLVSNRTMEVMQARCPNKRRHTP